MTQTKEKADTLTLASDPDTTRNSILTDDAEPVKTRKDNRCRNYTAILYPESAKENWQQILSDAHVEALVSPLHDRDVNSQGELKKAHHHVMIMFQGNKSKDQAQALFDSLGATQCQTINSIRGEARYLCHLDDPSKEQYDIKDVLEFGGADYQGIISLASDKYGVLREILGFIELNNILSFSELFRWTSQNNERWFRALADSCAYVIKEYLASRKFTIENGLVQKTETWITDPDQARRLLSAPATEEDPGQEVPF